MARSTIYDRAAFLCFVSEFPLFNTHGRSGDARELRNVIERMAIFTSGD